MNNIDISNWKPFRISDLFDVHKGTRLTRANMKEGNMRYIGASSFNNGITAYIANDTNIHPANTITISYNGSVGEAFYQNQPFWASDDVNVLYPKFRLSENIALYIVPILKSVGRRYAFVDKWKKEDMEQALIYLPVVQTGEPDFAYMEEFMCFILAKQRNKLQQLKDLAESSLSPVSC